MTTTSQAPARRRDHGAAGDVVAVACRAPSGHNTQPWRWRVTGRTLELYADEARRLPHADPQGRDLYLSCGAALHHAQVAARGLGWSPTVHRWPHGPDSRLLARITLDPFEPTARDLALLEALHERRTDRRRFTAWPVRGARLERLAAVAREQQGDAVALHDVVDRLRVERLVGRAAAVQAADAALVAEHRRLTDRRSADGVPGHLVPAAGDPFHRRPCAAGGRLPGAEPDIETTDGMVVLCGQDDDPQAWCATGEALGVLWLHAVLDGLAVVPLSQVVAVDATRASLQHEVLRGAAVPHLLLRVGWRALSEGQLPSSPRRPLADVLLARPGPPGVGGADHERT